MAANDAPSRSVFVTGKPVPQLVEQVIAAAQARREQNATLVGNSAEADQAYLPPFTACESELRDIFGLIGALDDSAGKGTALRLLYDPKQRTVGFEIRFRSKNSAAIARQLDGECLRHFRLMVDGGGGGGAGTGTTMSEGATGRPPAETSSSSPSGVPTGSASGDMAKGAGGEGTSALLLEDGFLPCNHRVPQDLRLHPWLVVAAKRLCEKGEGAVAPPPLVPCNEKAPTAATDPIAGVATPSLSSHVNSSDAAAASSTEATTVPVSTLFDQLRAAQEDALNALQRVDALRDELDEVRNAYQRKIQKGAAPRPPRPQPAAFATAVPSTTVQSLGMAPSVRGEGPPTPSGGSAPASPLPEGYHLRLASHTVAVLRCELDVPFLHRVIRQLGQVGPISRYMICQQTAAASSIMPVDGLHSRMNGDDARKRAWLARTGCLVVEFEDARSVEALFVGDGTAKWAFSSARRRLGDAEVEQGTAVTTMPQNGLGSKRLRTTGEDDGDKGGSATFSTHQLPPAISSSASTIAAGQIEVILPPTNTNAATTSGDANAASIVCLVVPASRVLAAPIYGVDAAPMAFPPTSSTRSAAMPCLPVLFPSLTFSYGAADIADVQSRLATFLR